jgi:hypothetical protein
VRSSRGKVREQTMKQGESEGWIWKSYISRTHRNLCSCKIGNTYQLIDDLRISELVDSPVYANSATNPYMVCFCLRKPLNDVVSSTSRAMTWRTSGSLANMSRTLRSTPKQLIARYTYYTEPREPLSSLSLKNVFEAIKGPITVAIPLNA